MSIAGAPESTTENGYHPLVDVDDYEDISNGEVPHNANPLKKIIARARYRCTLPRPVDNTGRKKNIIQNIEYISLVVAFIGLLVFFSSWNATHPMVSIETTVASNLELPLLENHSSSYGALIDFKLPQICFPGNRFPFVYLQALLARTSSGFNCEGDNFADGNATACNGMLQFNETALKSCVVFGGDQAPWTFNGTTERAELMLYVLSYAFEKKPFAFVEMNWLQKVGVPFPNNTIYITRPSGYNNLDIRKEVEIDAQQLEVVRFPTDIHFMPLQPEEIEYLCTINNCSNFVHGEIIDFLILAIRVHTTRVTIIQDQTDLSLLLRILTDVGSIMSLVVTLFGFIFGTFITRVVFSRKDAFFDTDTRLAITYFKSMQKRNNSFVNLHALAQESKYAPPVKSNDDNMTRSHVN